MVLEYSKKVLIILCCFWLKLSSCINYAVSGSFESPALGVNVKLADTATGWTGQFFKLCNDNYNLGFGQYINLQRNTS